MSSFPAPLGSPWSTDSGVTELLRPSQERMLLREVNTAAVLPRLDKTFTKAEATDARRIPADFIDELEEEDAWLLAL